MQLENKTAVVYGAGGAIGGAVARGFALAGARVALTGRELGPLETAVKEIVAHGGVAEAARVDALDATAVREHADGVVRRHGSLDISLNAIGVPQEGVQGVGLLDLELARFQAPVHAYLSSHFLTAQAAGRHMVSQGSGVIITLAAAPSKAAVPFMGGMSPAWAAIEALTRGLAAELGPRGVRAVCLRPDAIPATGTIDVVFGLHAEALGITRQQFAEAMRERTALKRFPTLAEVAATAVFLASAGAGAMTGTVANLSDAAWPFPATRLLHQIGWMYSAERGWRRTPIARWWCATAAPGIRSSARSVGPSSATRTATSSGSAAHRLDGDVATHAEPSTAGAGSRARVGGKTGQDEPFLLRASTCYRSVATRKTT